MVRSFQQPRHVGVVARLVRGGPESCVPHGQLPCLRSAARRRAGGHALLHIGIAAVKASSGQGADQTAETSD